MVSLLELEGLALVGLVREVSLEDCEVGPARRSRVRVVLLDGRSLESECMLYERVVRSYLVLTKYVTLGKSIGKALTEEEVTERVRFDLE